MITKEYLQQELAKRIKGYKPGVETTTDNIIVEMKSILVLVDALPDYEKKYNEALERASHIKDNNTVATPQEVAEHIFPELRESDDERIRKKCMSFIRKWSSKEDRDECLAYLEKQKEQKPEWSEEDEKMLWSAINGLNIHIYEKERAWLANKLKSLRPQPSWKPSEEQMEALETTAHLANFGCDIGRRNTLLSLCNELKKL